jgi:helicase SWR1
VTSEDIVVAHRKQQQHGIRPKIKQGVAIEPVVPAPIEASSHRSAQHRKSILAQAEPGGDIGANIQEMTEPSSARGRGVKRKPETTSTRGKAKSKRARAASISRSPSPLIVSPAVFRLTCPEQAVEPGARFGGSVQTYLSSYIMLDEKDIDENSLRRQVNLSAQTRERIRLFRKHGRMLGQLEEEADSEDEGIDGQASTGQRSDRNKKMSISAMKAAIEPKRVPDYGDHLIAHAAQVRNAMLAEWKNHNAIARKIARAVQIYWERVNNKDDRLEKEEERKRKLLMRELVKAIRAKWQLAVNVVRARRQAEEKAEQDRLGKKHLDLILERSKNLLEGQQTIDTYDEQDNDSETQTQISEPGSTEESEDEGEADEEDEETEEEEEFKATEDEAEHAIGLKSRSRDDREADSHDVSMELLVPESPVEFPTDSTEEDQLAQESPDPLAANIDITSSKERSTEQETMGRQTENQTTRKVDISSSKRTEMKPTRLTRRQVRMEPSGVTTSSPQNQDDPDDDDDVEFANEENVSDEDMGLDVEMEQDDAAMDSDDEEDEGLLADADLPLDQLMAKYGYAANPIATVLDTQSGVSDMGSDRGSEAEVEISGSDMPEDESASDTVSEISDVETLAEDTPRTPFLIRADLRPYQKAGLRWLAQLYQDQRNAILADEMGLGKTLQTISLLAHLACDHGNWGPHLIVVPTSVILNWEMEFKKFLPGFKVLTYYGNQQERKELRKGWLAPHAFEVLITSYQIVLADEFVFKRRQWQYLILDEAHNIKNFRSQRWQTLLGFRSERRLLLTGTPLQNNLMELWSLLYFLMPQGLTNDEETGGFANHKEFNEWFSSTSLCRKPVLVFLTGILHCQIQWRRLSNWAEHCQTRPRLLSTDCTSFFVLSSSGD